MNNRSYLLETFLNKRVFAHAALRAYKHLMWPMSIIGLPIVLFGVKDSLINKLFFFLGMSFLFLIPYVIFCFILHRYSLKNENQKDEFLSLAPKERGKVIGDELSGWW